MAAAVQSMHPGVIRGKREHVRVNTCANSTLHKRMERQLKGIEGHLENFPNDGLSQARAADIRSILKG
jgi:hypothetical protein